MLGRPSHVFLTLAQAYIFDIRRPIYYFPDLFIENPFSFPYTKFWRSYTPPNGQEDLSEEHAE